MPSADASTPGPDQIIEARMVYVILAEQMAALSEKIAGSKIFDKISSCGDMAATLAAQPKPNLTIAAMLETALDQLGFDYAQQQDISRQTVDLVMRALGLFSSSDGAAAIKDPVGALRALYVSEEQRKLHDKILVELGGARQFASSPTARR